MIKSTNGGLKRASSLAVLNANYIKEQLKGIFHLPYDRQCMHECVFSDKNQESYKITTLDIAKRLIYFGFHPPTIYFPLVVQGAIMIEPTETESKETLDAFVDALEHIAEEAHSDPDLLKQPPTTHNLVGWMKLKQLVTLFYAAGSQKSMRPHKQIR